MGRFRVRSALCNFVLLSVTLSASPAGLAQTEPEIPLPPPEEPAPCPDPRVSQPVVSYRISGMCEVTAVKAVGAYRYGTQELMEAVSAFPQSETVRRLEGGEMVYVRRIEIPLHRALEPPARLVCHADMMKTRILDAEILRPAAPGKPPVPEPVRLENGRLPDLGLFTYTRDFPVPDADCPGQEP
jgi:hypothetical protein